MSTSAPSLPLTRLAFTSTALFLMVLAAPLAHAGELPAFLERAERMATVNEAVEAEVTITEADGGTRKAHLALSPKDDGTLTFDESTMGWTSTTPLAWKQGQATVKTGSSPAAFGVNDSLAGTDLRGIDYFPFWKTDYGRAFVSDTNAQEQTVSLFADQGRPYSLYVLTFDKERFVPTMIKFYKDSFSNLTRIRTNEDYVLVGSRLRPQKVTERDFTTNTTRTYTFVWKLAGS